MPKTEGPLCSGVAIDIGPLSSRLLTWPIRRQLACDLMNTQHLVPLPLIHIFNPVRALASRKLNHRSCY